jgi:hypothetical protein
MGWDGIMGYGVAMKISLMSSIVHSLCFHVYLQANAIGGRNEKAVLEFLEKNWSAEQSEEESVRLAVKALMEVVDSGSKNIEVAIIRKGKAVHVSGPGPDLTSLLSLSCLIY